MQGRQYDSSLPLDVAEAIEAHGARELIDAVALHEIVYQRIVQLLFEFLKIGIVEHGLLIEVDCLGLGRHLRRRFDGGRLFEGLESFVDILEFVRGYFRFDVGRLFDRLEIRNFLDWLHFDGLQNFFRLENVVEIEAGVVAELFGFDARIVGDQLYAVLLEIIEFRLQAVFQVLGLGRIDRVRREFLVEELDAPFDLDDELIELVKGDRRRAPFCVFALIERLGNALADDTEEAESPVRRRRHRERRQPAGWSARPPD